MQLMQQMTEAFNSHLSVEEKQPDIPQVYGVGGACFEAVWEAAQPYLKSALPYADGKYTLADIKKAVQSQDMQLWMGFDRKGVCGACVTQIVCFPNSKRLVILFYGGRRTRSLLAAQSIFQWAITVGCKEIELFGRPGWERLLTRWGYDFEKVHTVLRLKL